MPRNPARWTKTGDGEEEGRALLVGPPVEALREWLSGPTSRRGRSFRRSTDGKPRRDKALTPQSIDQIVKRRCSMSGLELEAFFGAPLRAEYLTEAARRGQARAALLEATEHSERPPFQRAASYDDEADRAGQGGQGGALIGPSRGCGPATPAILHPASLGQAVN
jgi:hypothetical protein